MVETSTDLVNDQNAPPKTAKQLEKEAKKLAKLEKFKQKVDKKETLTTGTSKPKEKTEVIILIFSMNCTSHSNENLIYFKCTTWSIWFLILLRHPWLPCQFYSSTCLHLFPMRNLN